jgi:hypothetical protein
METEMFKVVQMISGHEVKMSGKVSAERAHQIMINYNRGLNRSDRAALAWAKKQGFKIVAA